MKLNKIIPLITLMTGVLLPINIAEAGSSAAPSTKETVNHSEQSGHKKDDGTTPKPVLSKEFHEIKFLVVLGLIGSALILPEVLPKSKNTDQDHHENDPQSAESEAEVSYDTLKNLNLVPDESAKVKNQGKKDLAAKEHRAS